VGLRKDKAFMQENSDGTKSQFSSYSESDHFLYDPKMDSVFELIEVEEQKKEKADAEVKRLLETVQWKSVRELKKDY